MSDLLVAPWRLAVLLAAPDPQEIELLRSYLAQRKHESFQVTAVPHLDEAIAELRRRPYDLLLVSLHFSDPAGAEILLRIRGLAPRLPVVVVARGADEETALQAVQAGVQDVIDPDTLEPNNLARTLRHSLARHNLLTEMRRAQQAASAHSFFDSVTGLANRAAFVRRLEETLTIASRFGERPSVVLIGIDGLSRLRESFGPLLTSRVLQETGRRLLWCVRRSDLAARLGGERFAILLAHIKDLQAAHTVAERIRTALAEPMENHPRRPRLTVSVGIACPPEDGENAEALLQQAEFALARARARGGNCSRFSQSPGFLLQPPSRTASEWPKALTIEVT
jgi:diguanylate cyclase (GGDEF)-like protein